MKQRAVPVLIGVSAVVAVLAGCAGLSRDVGEQVSRDRDIPAVTAISLRTSGTVTVIPGPTPSLTITAGDQVIDRLTSEERDGVLVLDAEGTHFGSLGQVAYTLVLPAVDAITIDGSGSVDAELTAADDLALTINGSGDLVGQGIDAENLTVRIEGSGRVELTGTAAREVVAIEGSGDYRGAGLRSVEADVEIEGSGNADVDVTGTLDAVIEGSGSVTHTGGATVTRHLTGSGRVDKG